MASRAQGVLARAARQDEPVGQDLDAPAEPRRIGLQRLHARAQDIGGLGKLDEQPIGLADDELAAFGRLPRLRDRWKRHGLWPQIAIARLEMRAVEREIVLGPGKFQQPQPFRVVLQPLGRGPRGHAEHREIRLDPSRHDVDSAASAADTVGVVDHAGSEKRVKDEGMDRGKKQHPVRDCGKRRDEGHGLQPQALEVHAAAERGPPGTGQEKVEPCGFRSKGDGPVVLPGRHGRARMSADRERAGPGRHENAQHGAGGWGCLDGHKVGPRGIIRDERERCPTAGSASRAAQNSVIVWRRVGALPYAVLIIPRR